MILALLLAFVPKPIQHVVIIVQENRTVDNLFQGYPGANTQSYGYAGSQKIALKARGLVTSWDIDHSHPGWKAAYDSGAMDGFNNEQCLGCPTNAPYSYVPQTQVQPYWTLAQRFVLADNTFQTNQGPSFPAHQYLMSATSVIECGATCSNLKFSENGPAGCDAGNGTRIPTIDQSGSENQSAYPCRSANSLIQELMIAGLSWHYYQSGAGIGLWHGPDALEYLCPTTPCNGNASYAANVVTTPGSVITDVQNGTLASVTWVTPTSQASDHANETDGSGPSWVASVVNAIGESQFWNSTAIFVTWDDWGGWYDHVAPQVVDSYDYGFRVPLLIVSPYARNDYVDHTQCQVYGSLAKYIEESFSLPPMGVYDTDAMACDYSEAFNYAQPPPPFTPILGSMPVKHWLAQTGVGMDY